MQGILGEAPRVIYEVGVALRVAMIEPQISHIHLSFLNCKERLREDINLGDK